MIPLRASFPADSSVVMLTDTLTKLLAETKRQCDVIRGIRTSRGEAAPECKVE
jgi:hypothetical protein